MWIHQLGGGSILFSSCGLTHFFLVISCLRLSFVCIFYRVALLGLWPYSMRRLITVWTNSPFNIFSLTVFNSRVNGTVTVCSLDGVRNYVVFTFNVVRYWEHRVVTWLITMCRCLLGEPVPLGLSCDGLFQLSGIFQFSTELGSSS